MKKETFENKRQNFRLVHIESIRRRQNKCDRKLKFVLGRVEKHCGKRRKCWLPAFSPFSTMFSKGFFSKVVKSRDCVVKTLMKNVEVTGKASAALAQKDKIIVQRVQMSLSDHLLLFGRTSDYLLVAL